MQRLTDLLTRINAPTYMNANDKCELIEINKEITDIVIKTIVEGSIAKSKWTISDKQDIQHRMKELDVMNGVYDVDEQKRLLYTSVKDVKASSRFTKETHGKMVIMGLKTRNPEIIETLEQIRKNDYRMLSTHKNTLIKHTKPDTNNPNITINENITINGNITINENITINDDAIVDENITINDDVIVNDDDVDAQEKRLDGTIKRYSVFTRENPARYITFEESKNVYRLRYLNHDVKNTSLKKVVDMLKYLLKINKGCKDEQDTILMGKKGKKGNGDSKKSPELAKKIKTKQNKSRINNNNDDDSNNNCKKIIWTHMKPFNIVHYQNKSIILYEYESNIYFDLNQTLSVLDLKNVDKKYYACDEFIEIKDTRDNIHGGFYIKDFINQNSFYHILLHSDTDFAKQFKTEVANILDILTKQGKIGIHNNKLQINNHEHNLVTTNTSSINTSLNNTSSTDDFDIDESELNASFDLQEILHNYDNYVQQTISSDTSTTSTTIITSSLKPVYFPNESKQELHAFIKDKIAHFDGLNLGPYINKPLLYMCILDIIDPSGHHRILCKIGYTENILKRKIGLMREYKCKTVYFIGLKNGFNLQEEKLLHSTIKSIHPNSHVEYTITTKANTYEKTEIYVFEKKLYDFFMAYCSKDPINDQQPYSSIIEIVKHNTSLNDERFNACLNAVIHNNPSLTKLWLENEAKLCAQKLEHDAKYNIKYLDFQTHTQNYEIRKLELNIQNEQSKREYEQKKEQEQSKRIFEDELSKREYAFKMAEIQVRLVEAQVKQAEIQVKMMQLQQ